MEINPDKTIKDAIDTDIEQGVGLMAYRKYLWALFYIKKKIDEYESYLYEITTPVKNKIKSLEENESFIRNRIENSIKSDPAADKTKTGGKSVILPDVGKISLSGDSDKIVYVDETATMNQLGEEFIEVKQSLRKDELKSFIKDQCVIKGDQIIIKSTGEVLQGLSVKKSQVFKISLN